MNTIVPFTSSLSDVHDHFFAPIEMEFHRVFDEIFGDRSFLNRVKQSTYPKLDASIEGDEWVVRLATPGVKKEDMQVEWKDRQLKIAGRISSEHRNEGAKYQCRELMKGKFIRSFSVPDYVIGEPAAAYNDGILTLRWKHNLCPETPKVEKPTKLIEIN